MCSSDLEALVEGRKGAGTSAPRGASARATARKILELAVPCADVGLVPGGTARLRIRLRTGAGEVQLKEIVLRAPAAGGRRDGIA